MEFNNINSNGENVVISNYNFILFYFILLYFIYLFIFIQNC